MLVSATIRVGRQTRLQRKCRCHRAFNLVVRQIISLNKVEACPESYITFFFYFLFFELRYFCMIWDVLTHLCKKDKRIWNTYHCSSPRVTDTGKQTTCIACNWSKFCNASNLSSLASCYLFKYEKGIAFWIFLEAIYFFYDYHKELKTIWGRME